MANPWGDDNTWRNVAITAAFSTCVGLPIALCVAFVPHGWPYAILGAVLLWIAPPFLVGIASRQRYQLRRQQRGPLGPLWPPK